MAAAGRHAEMTTLGLTKAASRDEIEVDFKTLNTPLVEWEGDLLAIGVFEDELPKAGDSALANSPLLSLDTALGGVLQELALEDAFDGKVGQAAVVRLASSKLRRLALIGLGSSKAALAAHGKPDALHAFGEKAASIAKPLKVTSLGLAAINSEALDNNAAVEAVISGVILGTYEDTRFKSQAKPSTLRQVSISTGGNQITAVERAISISAGVILAKQLVAAPANVLTPGALADAVNNIALAHGDVFTAKILEKAECEALGMGAYLGVANASDLPPKFIHLKYTPPDGSVHKRLAIIGKGITHDTGGYNIKTGAGCKIECMKVDMGGAGAAFGAAEAIGKLKPKGVEVHFISAACENMISGKGMRPGDIITASNGKTIEVNNTDAEGRLTLADALVYACRLRVDAIVDLATLTGAIVVALGNNVAGFFSSSDALAEELASAAQAAGEKMWRMPLIEEYKEALKSPVADYVNTGGRPGGAITAALFLREFVDEGTDWAHIDIAGPAFDEKKGEATGYGVQTLVKWICSQEKL